MGVTKFAVAGLPIAMKVMDAEFIDAKERVGRNGTAIMVDWGVKYFLGLVSDGGDLDGIYESEKVENVDATGVFVGQTQVGGFFRWPRFNYPPDVFTLSRGVLIKSGITISELKRRTRAEIAEKHGELEKHQKIMYYATVLGETEANAHDVAESGYKLLGSTWTLPQKDKETLFFQRDPAAVLGVKPGLGDKKFMGKYQLDV